VRGRVEKFREGTGVGRLALHQQRGGIRAGLVGAELEPGSQDRSARRKLDAPEANPHRPQNGEVGHQLEVVARECHRRDALLGVVAARRDAQLELERFAVRAGDPLEGAEVGRRTVVRRRGQVEHDLGAVREKGDTRIDGGAAVLEQEVAREQRVGEQRARRLDVRADEVRPIRSSPSRLDPNALRSIRNERGVSSL